MRVEHGSVLSGNARLPVARDEAIDLRAMLRLLALAHSIPNASSFVRAVLPELFALVPYDLITDDRLDLSVSRSRSGSVLARRRAS